VEALTGDFGGNLPFVSLVAQSGLDVYAHNIETVEALTPYVRDRRATFRQSLSVLEHAKGEGVRVTKTSIMLGVGEIEEQVMDALKGTCHSPCIILIYVDGGIHAFSAELRKIDVDVVTFGQYMRPTKRHMKVDRYVEPSEFDRWKEIAENMGFLYVASGPLVRSSYKVGGLLRLWTYSGLDYTFRRRGSILLKTYCGSRMTECWTTPFSSAKATEKSV
jgi:lipoic acid synthetase